MHGSEESLDVVVPMCVSIVVILDDIRKVLVTYSSPFKLYDNKVFLRNGNGLADGFTGTWL